MKATGNFDFWFDSPYKARYWLCSEGHEMITKRADGMKECKAYKCPGKLKEVTKNSDNAPKKAKK